MSLVVWLPLNGSLENKGISHITTNVQSGVAVDNNGKIGKCYTNSGTSVNVAIPFSFITKQFSLCAWVKINTRRNNWCRAFGLSGSGNYIGLGCEHTNGTGFGFHFYKTINGTNTSVFDTYPLTFSTGIWAHFLMAYDGTKYYIYKDGTLIASANANQTNIEANMNTLYLFGGTANSYSLCSLNDVRIYDHCLSAAEVHEISQGLVLHYKLDASGGGFANSNLLTGNVNEASTWTLNQATATNNDGGIRVQITSDTGDRRIYKSVTNVWTPANSTFTVSFEAKAATNNITLNVSRSNIATDMIDFPLTTKWQHYSGQIVNTAATNGGTLSIRCITNGTIFWIKNVKLERGEIETRFLTSTESSAIIQDSSGYGHNGTIVNTPSLVTSQARYTSNIHFSANNQHIQLPAITYSNFGNSFTIAWWGKRSTHSNMMFWGFSDGNRLNGMYNGTLWNTGDGSNNPIYKPGTTTTITAPTATSWHHYVMVGNGTKSQLYVDGILYGEAKTYKGLTGTSIWINGWRNHTEYSSTDMDISDFRIYCTALSADDILSLYHTAAKVDNLGGLHTFEFQEKGPNKIYKTGITQGQEISEINGMSNLKYDPNVYIEPDGSAWVRIFHHVNPTSNKFASSDTFTTGIYKDENRWFNFDLCNYTDKWEFIAAVTRTNTDTLERYRWIQNANPLNATFDQTKVANVTRITTGYNTSPLGGLYHVSGSSWLAANNGTNNNWFGATGCWTAWNGGIPGWKSTAAGDAVTTGTIDIYLRIDNITTTMPSIAKSTKNNIWVGHTLIER